MNENDASQPPTGSRVGALLYAVLAAVLAWVAGLITFELLRRLWEAMSVGPPDVHGSSIAFLEVIMFCTAWLVAPMVVAVKVGRRVYKACLGVL